MTLVETPPSRCLHISASLRATASLLIMCLVGGLCRAAAEERAPVGAAAGADEEAVGREHAAHATHRRHARSVSGPTHYPIPFFCTQATIRLLSVCPTFLPPPQGAPLPSSPRHLSLCSFFDAGREGEAFTRTTGPDGSTVLSSMGTRRPSHPTEDRQGASATQTLDHTHTIHTYHGVAGAHQMNHTCLINGVGVIQAVCVCWRRSCAWSSSVVRSSSSDCNRYRALAFPPHFSPPQSVSPPGLQCRPPHDAPLCSHMCPRPFGHYYSSPLLS